MKAIIFFVSILMSAFSFAGQNVKCELQYFGDSDKFKVTQFSFMGIPSDSYLYTCADCGGIQINVFPSIQTVAPTHLKTTLISKGKSMLNTTEKT